MDGKLSRGEPEGDPLLKAGRGLEAKSEVGAEELGHLSRVGESPHPPAKAAQLDSPWTWVRRLKAFPEGPSRMVGC